MFDVAKERYVTGLGIPYNGSKLLLADQWTEMERARRDRRWADALLLGAFLRYARLVRALGIISDVTPAGRPMARRQIRLWTWLGLGTHMMCLYVAIALSSVWPPALPACSDPVRDGDERAACRALVVAACADAHGTRPAGLTSCATIDPLHVRPQ